MISKDADKKNKTGLSLISVTDNSTKHGGNAVYGLGFIGSLIYFLQTADSFWVGVGGIFKALVWPAIVAYKLLESFYS